MRCEPSPGLYSNLPNSIASEHRLWLPMFSLTEKNNVNLGASLYTLILYFRDPLFSYLSFWFFFAAVEVWRWGQYADKNSYCKLQKEVLSIFLSLARSLGSPLRRLCVAMDSPKAISLFLTIQHIHTWLILSKDMGPGVDHLFFSLCALDALLRSSLPLQPIASFLSHGFWRGHSPHRCPRRVGPDPKTMPHAASSQMTSGRS